MMLDAVVKLILLFAGAIIGGALAQFLMRRSKRIADRRAVRFVLVLVAAVAGGALLMAFAEAAVEQVTQTPIPEPTLENAPNAPALPAKADPPPTPQSGMQVVQQSYYTTSSGVLVIVGEVRNIGGIPLEEIEVIAMLYEDDRFIGSDKGWAVVDVVLPGEQALFEVWYSDAPAGWDRYELQLQAEPASDHALERHYPHFEVEASVELRKNKWTVFGTVTNTGGRAMRLVEVYMGLYAKDGTLLSIANDYVDLDQIGPGETSTFTTYAYKDHLTAAVPVDAWKAWVDAAPVETD